MPGAVETLQRFFSSKEGQSTTQDEETRQMVGTPWVARTSGGLWVGADNSVWLYRKFPEYQYAWETADIQLTKGTVLHQLLDELGRTSRAPQVGEFASLSKNRRVHLVTHIRYVAPPTPVGSTAEHKAFLDEMYHATAMVVPDQLTAIGVELWPSAAPGRRRKQRSTFTQLKDWAAAMTNQGMPDLELYEADAQSVSNILNHYGVDNLRRDERLFMERWISGGTTDEPFLVEESDRIVVRDRNPKAFDRWTHLHDLADEVEKDGDRARAEELTLEAEQSIIDGGNVIQFMAASESGMPERIGVAPWAPWLMDAQQHNNAAICTELRFVLEPGSVTRNQARKSQKHAYRQVEEEAEASPLLSRIESEEALVGAKSVEDHYAATAEPAIRKMSLLWAWEVAETDENFSDFLRSRYDIDATPLMYRQFDAYFETLPTCSVLAAPDRPYSHDSLLSTIAHSGVGASSVLGDDIRPSPDPRVRPPEAVWTGVSHPSGTPVWTNPWAASEQNTSPTMVVIGQPGSGKTFLLQFMCYQFALLGIPVFFINPKGSDSLRDYAEFCHGETISISDVAAKPGAFDPFRFAEGETIAEIAVEHIITSMNNRGDGFSKAQTIALGTALREGIERGARCVGQCIAHLLPEEHAQMRHEILEFSRQNRNFGLGIGWEPRGPLGGQSRFTLVEFDQESNLPERVDPSSLTMTENSAIAGQRLLWRAGIEVMRKAGGGVVAGDEAWTFLSSPQAASIINGLNRKGRSLGIFLALMTQRIADVVDADLEAYLSRVAVLHLEDQREIEAALQLCRMEVSPELVNLIRSAKPVPPDRGDPLRGVPPRPARPAQMIFRDINGRHGVATVEPVLEPYRLAFSTNRLDKHAREQAREETELVTGAGAR
jgi:hypothetical protein